MKSILGRFEDYAHYTCLYLSITDYPTYINHVYWLNIWPAAKLRYLCLLISRPKNVVQITHKDIYYYHAGEIMLFEHGPANIPPNPFLSGHLFWVCYGYSYESDIHSGSEKNRIVKFVLIFSKRQLYQSGDSRKTW